MKVYLVEDVEGNPGRILAIFHDEEDAEWFANQLPKRGLVEERTLFYGQPSICGYNE